MRLIRLLKNDLSRECSEWVKDDLISEKQAEKICHRYGVNYQNPSKKTYGYAVLTGLAYLFIGLAVITLLSANWDDIPRATRMSGLILFTLATNLFALKKYMHGKLSEATGLFFLGSLLYGASIMLIAQIYHIDEHYPDGVLWWAVGVLPLALLLKSSLLIYLVTGLAFIWFFVEVNLNYYPVVFPVFLLSIGWHIFRVKQSNSLFLIFIFGLVLWLEHTLAWFLNYGYGYDFKADCLVLVIGLFLVFHAVAKWLVVQKNHTLIDYGTILGIWVLRFTILTLLFFSDDWQWQKLIGADWPDLKLTAVIVIALSSIAVCFSYLANRQSYSTLFFALVFIICTGFVINISDALYALYFQIITNMVLIVAGTWLIIKGIKDDITHYFFLGVLSILLTGLLRYIALFGDYVDTSILFTLFAVILLSAARFRKSYQASQTNP